MAYTNPSPDPSREIDCAKHRRLATEHTYGGYARLAEFMSAVPEATVFHRFADLSIQSLLHYQSELQDLKRELQDVQTADQDTGLHTTLGTYAFSSGILRHSENDDGNLTQQAQRRQSKQWKLLKRIRTLTQEYYTAVTLHHQIVNMRSPQRQTMRDLNGWMRNPFRGNIRLIGSDSNIWDTSNPDELLTMAPLSSDQTNSTRLSIYVVETYHKLIGRYVHSEPSEPSTYEVAYSSEWIFPITRMVIHVVKALAASMLPIISVVILYFIKNEALRLGLVAAFTAAFSLALRICTSAEIKDVFSATAAFSAVLVVFVGTTLGNKD